MLRRIISIIALIGGMVSMGGAQAMFFTRPYETILRPEMKKNYCFAATAFVEHGFSMEGLDGDGHRVDGDGHEVNVLRIWNAYQDALAMLDGFDPASAIGQRRTLVNANDDKIRGRYLVHGDLDMKFDASFAVRWGFPYSFSLGLFLPVYSLQLKNVVWENQTQNITADDARVRNYLTNDFFANVAQLGGLDLQGWKRSGIGDLTMLAEWWRDFKQNKDFLNNVRLQGHAGFSLPTGKHCDEDKIFALPFGNDGAFGIIFGGGIELGFGTYARLGLDVELMHAFSTLRERRIKTAFEQTELLLLAKATALRDYGLTQKFNLTWGMQRVFGGLSGKVAYQFLKHSDDALYLHTNNFSNRIANSARSLEEWTLHNLFFVLSYDGEHSCDHRAHPYAAVFVKIPFNGQFSLLSKTVGIELSVDF